MKKIVIRNGAPGCAKTTNLIAAARSVVSEKDDRFQTGLEPVRVAILTFTNVNSYQCQQRELSKIPLFSKTDFYHSTVDKLFKRICRTDSEIKYGNSNELDFNRWKQFLATGQYPPGIEARSPTLFLMDLLTGKISLSDDDKYEIVFVDEAQDLKPRHHIFLLTLLRKGYIGHLELWGDIHQTLYGDAGCITERFKSWPESCSPFELIRLIERRMDLSIADDIIFEEKEPNTTSLRFSKSFLASALNSKNPHIRGLLLEKYLDYPLHAEKIGDENDFLKEIKISDLRPDMEIETVQISKNILSGHPSISRDTYYFLEKIEKQVGRPILAFYHPDALKKLKKIFFPETDSPNSDFSVLEDSLRITPQTEEGIFLKELSRNSISLGKGFRSFLKIYLKEVDRRWGPRWQNFAIGNFKVWIQRFDDVKPAVLDSRLEDEGLVSIRAWMALLKMHISGNVFEKLLPDYKIITSWTFQKAKGQTFEGPGLILSSEIEQALKISDDNQRNPKITSALRRNFYYTAVTRFSRQAYLL